MLLVLDLKKFQNTSKEASFEIKYPLIYYSYIRDECRPLLTANKYGRFVMKSSVHPWLTLNHVINNYHIYYKNQFLSRGGRNRPVESVTRSIDTKKP